MNDHTPTEHTIRHRRRRLRLNVAGAIVLALLILLTRATPTPPTSRHSTANSNSNQPAEIASTSSPHSSDGSLDSASTTILNAQPGLAHVDRDVDGDTIDITLAGHRDTVRFIGVDTPETHDPRKPVQCYGPEAAAHTRALLEGKDVRLAADPQDSDRDKYGRLLRYIYLPDGTLVNAELIQDGWGFAYTIFPFEKINQFRDLQNNAKAAGRGLWAACNVNSSSDILQTAGPKA